MPKALPVDTSDFTTDPSAYKGGGGGTALAAPGTSEAPDPSDFTTVPPSELATPAEARSTSKIPFGVQLGENLLMAGATSGGSAIGTATGPPIVGTLAGAGTGYSLSKAAIDKFNQRYGEGSDVFARGQLVPPSWGLTNYPGGKLAEDFTIGAGTEGVGRYGVPAAVGGISAVKGAITAGKEAEAPATEVLGREQTAREMQQQLGTTQQQLSAKGARPLGAEVYPESVAAQDAYFGAVSEAYKNQISGQYETALQGYKGNFIQTASTSPQTPGFGAEIARARTDLLSQGRPPFAASTESAVRNAIDLGGGVNGDGILYDAKGGIVGNHLQGGTVEQMLNAKSQLVGILTNPAARSADKAIAHVALEQIDNALANAQMPSGVKAFPPAVQARLAELGKQTRDFYDLYPTSISRGIGGANNTVDVGTALFSQGERPVMTIIQNGTPEQITRVRGLFADQVASKGDDLGKIVTFIQENPNVFKALYPGPLGRMDNFLRLLSYSSNHLAVNPRLQQELTNELTQSIQQNPQAAAELEQITRDASVGKIQKLPAAMGYMARRLGFGFAFSGPLALMGSTYGLARAGLFSLGMVPVAIDWGMRKLLTNPALAEQFFRTFVENPANKAQGVRLLMQMGWSGLSNEAMQYGRSKLQPAVPQGTPLPVVGVPSAPRAAAAPTPVASAADRDKQLAMNTQPRSSFFLTNQA